MTDRLVLDRDAASPQAILALGRMAVEQVNALHSAAHAEGWRISPWRERRLRDAYESVLARLSDAAPAVPGRLKSSLFGPYFRWTSVDGMINPFGLEAIANPDLLPFEQPFVAAHEWAHLAGYADESEASFVGFLTCIRAAAPAAYSGWLFLYWQDQLRSRVRRAASSRGGLDEGPRRDIAAIARARPQRAGSAVTRCGLARVRPVPESESCRRRRAQLRSRADAARTRAIRGGLAAGQARAIARSPGELPSDDPPRGGAAKPILNGRPESVIRKPAHQNHVYARGIELAKGRVQLRGNRLRREL